MILVYDTETTGLPDFKARSHEPTQPHIVQLALVEYADDGTEIRGRSVIVKPNGWVIPPETTAIHGITMERAMDEGIPEEHAAALFILAQGRANLRVAHNESFDRRIMRIAMVRTGFDRNFIDTIERRRARCTCVAATPIVQIPPTERMIAAGINTFKSASLGECTRHFFGEELTGAHDALVDARACGRLHFHLEQLAAAKTEPAMEENHA